MMGLEGKDRHRALEAGAQILSGQLGKTIQRLRKAYNLSLSELAEQSGVAKSIISQIERNETNPTLATIWRLSQALDVSIERVLATSDEEPFIDKSSRADTPILVSDDGRMRLAIIGWIKTVEWLQWYDVQSEPGGVLESDAHQRGSVECLSVLDGEFEVEIGGAIQHAKAGETLRYRCDRPHTVRCLGPSPGRATMVCILKAAVMD
jgi:transcriptional regulator with XRE-family HTH domain